MRVGFNPNKDKVLPKSDYFHQVIVPVCIPNQEGYYKDSFQILKYCLESLFKTSHSKTYFTVVNNGSSGEVMEYLNQLVNEGKLHEVIHTSAIGKINAILKGLTGHQFSLITISDADVLFLNNWQKATYAVYEAFPKTGVVCTTPSSKSFNYNTFNIISEKLFSKKLSFTAVINPEALFSFATSIENPTFYKPIHFEKYLTLSAKNVSAVIGAGHFVATYRGNLFYDIGITFSPFSLGGTSESRILDLPVIQKGYWRLSTLDNYTYHLGNVLEPWMNETLNGLKQEVGVEDIILMEPQKKPSKLIFWLKNVFPSKLMYKKKIRYIFLRFKGLTHKEAENY